MTAWLLQSRGPKGGRPVAAIRKIQFKSFYRKVLYMKMLPRSGGGPWPALLLMLVGCNGGPDPLPEPAQGMAVALLGSGSGSVTSSPAGLACTLAGGQQGGTCAATFDAGTAVTLSATPAAGSVFQAWGSGCTGSAACSVTMSGPRAITAQFTATSFALSIVGAGNGTGVVTSNPAGLVCDVAAGQVSGQCSASFPAGTGVSLRVIPGANSTLAGWLGACTGTSTCSVTMDAAKSATATLALLSYPVVVSGLGAGTGRVTSDPAGLDCTVTAGVTSGTCSTSFTSGSRVTLAAQPGLTSDFTGWSGFCAGTGTCALEVTGQRTVTAGFGVKSFALTVTGTGAGTGTITSSPSGINCILTAGVAAGSCTASFSAGTVVTLGRSLSGLNVFDGWSGACSGTGTCTVTMDAAKSVSAALSVAIQQVRLTVTPAGNGSGSVTSVPVGIACTITGGNGTGSCSAEFPAGTSVVLSGSAASPNSFGGWTGASCSGNGACSVTLTAATTVTAAFNYVAPTQPLTVTGAGGGSGSVTSAPAGISCTISGGVSNGACSFSFAENASVTLTATPSAGGSFSGWSGACSGTGSCAVTMSEARSVSAAFAAPPPAFAIQPDFAVLAAGGSRLFTATLSGTTLTSRNAATASVSGLTVTGVATGVTDLIGTNSGNTDSSRVAVVPTDGIAMIATSAQNVAFNSVASGATIGLDLWLIKPAGGTADLGSIQGGLSWDPARFQFVSFSTSGTAVGDGWIVTPNTAGSAGGSMLFAGFSATGTSASFPLARLVLRAVGSGTGSVVPTLSAAATASAAPIALGKIVAVPSGLRIP